MKESNENSAAAAGEPIVAQSVSEKAQQVFTARWLRGLDPRTEPALVFRGGQGLSDVDG